MLIYHCVLVLSLVFCFVLFICWNYIPRSQPTKSSPVHIKYVEGSTILEHNIHICAICGWEAFDSIRYNYTYRYYHIWSGVLSKAIQENTYINCKSEFQPEIAHIHSIIQYRFIVTTRVRSTDRSLIQFKVVWDQSGFESTIFSRIFWYNSEDHCS